MKSRSIIIGIFLSVVLVITAAGSYWLTSRAQADSEQLALSLSLIRRIQQLESQWSTETARVRSDPLSDFDTLSAFTPRMDWLKKELSAAMANIPDLPENLARNLGAYLSAIDAKEERIERFKTNYAVLRNSVRYLPLAATSVMQQVETRGGERTSIRNISSVTDQIHSYLSAPAPAERERLRHMLQELGNGIVIRHPSLATTIANFVAHGQVLLDRQTPTEEIFQEATSDRIGTLGEDLIKGLEAESAKVVERVSTYERGMLVSGGAIWLLWLFIALRLPKEGKKQAASRPTRQPRGQQEARAAMDKIAAAAPPPDGGMEKLATDLLKAEEQYGRQAMSARATESTAHRVGLEVIAGELTALAERINSNTDILGDVQAKLFSDGPAHAPDADNRPDDEMPFQAADDERKTATAVLESIRAQATGIVAFAQRLPSLSRKRDEVSVPVSINDCIDEIVDNTQAQTQALLVKELNPIPDVSASETEISLLLSNLIENAVWAVEQQTQKKGVVRIETGQTEDHGVMVAITDNGVGIDSEKRKKVFNPFYTSKDNAAGMGLTATQYLVDKYGGSLLMNSLPHQGTMVRVTLPTGTAVD